MDDQQQPAPAQDPPQNPSPAPSPGTYGDLQPDHGRKKKILTVIIGLLILAAIGAGAYLLLGKKDNKSASSGQSQQASDGSNANPGEDWKVIDTGLGFTVKAPPAWSGSLKATSKLGTLKTTSITVGNHNEAAANTEDYVSVGTQSDPQATTRDEFEKLVSDPDKIAAYFESLGLEKNQVKVSSAKTDIDGDSWVQVDIEVPNQLSRSLYFWVGDHAIVLTVANKDRAKLDRLIKQFLVPMAKSVELN